MTTALWILNGILATAFLIAGVSKEVRTKEALLASGQRWTVDFSAGRIKAIGVVEIIGALGLVLPLATAIPSVFAPIAALGLALHMAAAIAIHRRTHRGDPLGPAISLGATSVVSAGLGFAYVLG